jgi:predicted MPP superfamily phosphohydrolase
MKTRNLSILFVLLVNLTYAQSSEHLSFKGVPIDGTLDEFVLKMQQNGFMHLGTENNNAKLTGDFAGYKNCQLSVTTLNQKDLVYKIAVVFPNQDNWSRLSADYYELKQLLTEKYGKPSIMEEKFNDLSQTTDDNQRMYDIKFDRYKYYSIWQTDKGEIRLSIDHVSVNNCFVKLEYIDKINREIIKTKAKGDL